MINKIKNKINRELINYIDYLNRSYSLKSISPLLFKNIKEFILRKGKRVRPTLFVIGYLGFARKVAAGLYTSALSLELLHDFMLAHDDIIDKSTKRRGKPSMHERLNNYLQRFKNIKFTGQDLTIAIADVMFALGIHSFLAIEEDKSRKEMALRKLVEAVVYTGTGEVVELLTGLNDMRNIKRQDIYKIYDLKTARYTFACPLSAGAILGGASSEQAESLFKYGLYLGRAFQIKDDILGMFGEESQTGKSSLADLRESKRTLLIWYAYNNSSTRDKSIIRDTFIKKDVNRTDLLRIRKIVISSGALDYARLEIRGLLKKAKYLSMAFGMRSKYRDLLAGYVNQLLRA